MVEILGRDAELELVLARIRDRRLVTLVGPGGIGKTTLARAAADLVAGEFDEGAHLVDLTQVDDAAGVAEVVAGQLGHVSFRALLDSPGDHPVLLLVDNCEHVLDAAAEVVESMLDACRMPTVLATSRSALELPGEVVVPVGPLDLPAAGSSDSPAVDLFLRLAADAGAAVEPGPAVVELCRRLDGVPLALELAAARCRSLTVEEVLARLAEGLDVLDRPRRRAAPRHRGLRAAIDWSYELLDAGDRHLFERMSVLPGPVGVADVHEVAGLPGESAARTADRLDALEAASLLVARPDGATTTYRALEVLRAFGRERLEERGERRAVEERLVDAALADALAVVDASAGAGEAPGWASMRLAYDATVAALRWCLANDGSPDRARVLAAVLWPVAHEAHTEEIGALAEAVLARWPEPGPQWADVVSTAAACRLMLGATDDAVAMASDALPHAAGSPFAPVTLRRTIAFGRRAAGDLAGSMAAYAEVASVADELGLDALATDARTARAHVLADAGRPEEALAEVARLRDAGGAAWSDVAATWLLAVEGTIRLAADDLDGAERAVRAALDRSRADRYASGEAVALRGLGLIACRRDDPAGAAARALQLLEQILARGSTADLALVLDVAVPALALAGRTDAAADLEALAATLPVASVVSGPMSSSRFAVEGLPVRPAPTAREVLRWLRPVLAEVAVGGPEADAVPAHPGTGSARSGMFRLVGDVWQVGLDDVTVAMRPSKGLADLARLLASPGEEVHCLELAGSGLDQGPAGDALDGRARREYEARIRDLQHELDEADAAGDRGRAEKASLELDLLVDQLTSALGLGGRARPGGGAAERARSAVTQRVRSTIKRLRTVHPAVGRHLEASIRTGAFCCYRPEVPVAWDLGRTPGGPDPLA